MILLHAINPAKVLTLVTLLSFAYVYEIRGTRQILYFSMHTTYVIWWLVEQLFFPLRRTILQNTIDFPTAIMVFLLVGWGYALPGYLCFASSSPSIPTSQAIIGLMVYIFGFVFNSSCDFYVLGAKSVNPKIRVQDGVFSVWSYPQYIGDWMRYGAMAFVSGNIYSSVVPLFVVTFNLYSILQATLIC